MKTRLLFLLLTGCLLALAAWLVHVPNAAQADGVPEKYRDTVNKGLEYLAKNQCKDGHWEGDDGKHPVAMTALAGMALLMEGSSIDEGKYAANLRKATDWLLDQSQAGRDGLIYSGHPSETDRYMYGHGLATMFLGWRGHCADEALRKRRAEVVARAVAYIARARSTQGGWYRTSKVEGHDLDEIMATAIQMQALYTARAGIRLSDAAVRDAQQYLNIAVEKYEKNANPKDNHRRLTAVVAALACLSGAGCYDELRKKWFTYCTSEIPAGKAQLGSDELIHYFYARAMYDDSLSNGVINNPEIRPGWPLPPSVEWIAYRAAMFDQLQRSQNKDGSWPAADGIGVGPLYATAIWCTILQLDKTTHPLTQPRGRTTVTF